MKMFGKCRPASTENAFSLHDFSGTSMEKMLMRFFSGQYYIAN